MRSFTAHPLTPCPDILTAHDRKAAVMILAKRDIHLALVLQPISSNPEKYMRLDSARLEGLPVNRSPAPLAIKPRGTFLITGFIH